MGSFQCYIASVFKPQRKYFVTLVSLAAKKIQTSKTRIEETTEHVSHSY